MPKSAVFSVTLTANDEIELVEEEEVDDDMLDHETLLNIKHEADETDIKLVPNGDGIMTIKIPDETLKYSCNQCGKNYKNFGSFKRHSTVCGGMKAVKKPTIKILNKDEKRKYQRTPIEYSQMEKESKDLTEDNICFCCKEPLDGAHAGHIKCPYCPKLFKSEISKERHIVLLHAPTELYPCNICNVTCPTPGILELHLNAHKLGKQFGCKKCGKEFTRKYHLYRHENFTSCDPSKLTKELACIVCGKKFHRIDNLRSHLRVHLGEETKRKDYQCPFCDKSFLGTATLNIHIRTHTGERPFACDLCDKSFPSNPALVKHRRKHTGERPYKCGLCSRQFAAKEVLNRHMKTHTGERPHKCKHCGKSFIQGTQLKAHVFHHTGENGFKCTKCDASFNRNSLLTQHMASGCKNPKTNNKVACDICKKFYNPEYIKTHKKNAHSTKKQCPICKKMFNTKVKHENHMKKVHKDLLEQILEGKYDSEPQTNTSPPTSEEEGSDEGKLEIIDSMDIFESETEFKTKNNSEDEDDDDNDDDDDDEDDDDEDDEDYEDEDGDGAKELAVRQSKLKKNVINTNAKTKTKCKEEDSENSLFMNDADLKDSVSKLLNLLLDEEMLSEFGWPDAPVEEVLSAVIKQCGHEAADYSNCSDYTTKMRENVKLLFTVVVDNDSIKTLLNNHTIDEVMRQVLKMAKVN